MEVFLIALEQVVHDGDPDCEKLQSSRWPVQCVLPLIAVNTLFVKRVLLVLDSEALCDNFGHKTANRVDRIASLRNASFVAG